MVPRPATNHEPRRQELLAVAEQLFLEQGYDETSIEDIVRAAHVSKGALYHYFPSKAAILSASIDRLVGAATAEARTIADHPTWDSRQKLQGFFSAMARLQGSNARQATMLARLIPDEAAAAEALASTVGHLVVPLAAILTEAAADGHVHTPYPRETADLLVRALATFPQSPFAADYLSSPQRLGSYQAAAHDFVAKALGVPSDWVGRHQGQDSDPAVGD
jgi:AcrR family transcriptional regulator